jgi:uncharacterized SAM-binding protein YcdF (DUF218 family)
VRAIVIFGAAVRPGGEPSPALGRRIGYGLAAATADPEALVFCSGAAGRHGPSEASVMARMLLGQGVEPERLVLDEASRDTLQSAAAARFIRAGGLARAVVCTDGYHMARSLMLIRALGVPAERGPVPRGRAGARPRDWLYMRARETVAYPYDLGVVLWRRRELVR